MSSFFIIALLGAAVTALKIALPSSRRALQETTLSLGLHLEERPLLHSDVVSGTVKGYKLKIDCPTQTGLSSMLRSPRATRIRLSVPALPRYFAVRPDPDNEHSLKTGDARFDARFLVQGSAWTSPRGSTPRREG